MAYYIKHREELKKRAKTYYQTHREHCVLYAREHRRMHPELIRKARRLHRLKHGKEMDEKKKQHDWKHTIDTRVNGVRVRFRGLTKRDRPDKCELCGKQKPILHYHHWDNSNPSLGLWVCRFCHIGISVYEDGRINLYLEKKAEINAETTK